MQGLARAKSGASCMTERSRMVKVDLHEEKGMAAELLQSHHESYIEQDPKIQQGALVQWKDWMKNREMPAYGEPAVVVKLLDEPVLIQGDAPDSVEHLDVALGVLGDDSEFLVSFYDSHRFKACKTE